MHVQGVMTCLGGPSLIAFCHNTQNRTPQRKERLPSTMNEPAREYFWGVTLDKENPTFTWSFDEEEEDSDYLVHTLFLKQAVLGASAVEDERNLVQVETKNFDQKDLKQPLFSLTLGKNDMTSLDVSFGHEVPVVFRLVEGSGPVCLSAQQLVEFPEDKNISQDESELECTEDELAEEEEEEEESPKKGAAKKRKAPTQKSAKAKKKGKMEVSRGESGEDEDEDDEEMDEEDDDEEEMEEEEDEDEEDEGGSSPDKGGKKGKKGKDVKTDAKGKKGGKTAAKASPKKDGAKKAKKATGKAK